MPRNEEVFNIIAMAHLGLLHPGIQKILHEIDQTIASISRREVVELLRHCLTCAKKVLQKPQAPLKTIVENVV